MAVNRHRRGGLILKIKHTRLALVFVLTLAGIWFVSDARAEIKTKTITYKDGDITLKGMMAWDSAKSRKRPGVLVIDEWWGLTNYAKNRVRRLAAAGYVAFAADMYGDGRTTNDFKQARKLMKQVTGDVAVWNRRAQLGLDVLKAGPNVDGSKLAAIGSSFGGATAIQMAYAGHDIKVAVSIASSLAPVPKGVSAIKPRMLIFIGGDDKFIKAGKVTAFKAGLDRIKADWEIITYSGTRHSFTNPDAKSRGLENFVYNKKSAKRSWTAMITLFDEVFK